MIIEPFLAIKRNPDKGKKEREAFMIDEHAPRNIEHMDKRYDRRERKQ
jgi:hypothetical protein